MGAVPGEPFVDGTRFIQLSYGFYFSKIWMNFGIIIVFGIAFFIGLLLFT